MIFAKSVATMMLLAAVFTWTHATATADALYDQAADLDMMGIDVDAESEDLSGLDGQRNLSKLRQTTKRSRTVNIDLNVTNLSFQQPFGPFFVMVHNHRADPLFTLGGKSSRGLQILAENGSPADLVKMYKGNRNVLFVKAMGNGPLAAGGMTTLTVPFKSGFNFVTIASMAINTNDCFVALNSQRIQTGSFNSPGYDSGTEENNELCSSIPGPACNSTSGNVASGNGEGFVHVHRGFFGVGGELSEAPYDWRNPMMRVEIGRSSK